MNGSEEEVYTIDKMGGIEGDVVHVGQDGMMQLPNSRIRSWKTRLVMTSEE